MSAPDMKPGDVCGVECVINGWNNDQPAWFLARVTKLEKDADGDNNAVKVHLIGEAFDRDEWLFIGVIRNEAQQAAAQKLAAAQGQQFVAYRCKEDMRQAIVNAGW